MAGGGATPQIEATFHCALGWTLRRELWRKLSASMDGDFEDGEEVDLEDLAQAWHPPAEKRGGSKDPGLTSEPEKGSAASSKVKVGKHIWPHY